MKRDEPDNLDLLAAEYVIGTLTGSARRAFERRMLRDRFAQRQVQAWEERLLPLALSIAPVAPSPAVWGAIASRTGAAPGWGRWRALAAALAAVAVLGFGWVIWQELRPLPPQAAAVLATETGVELWRVEVSADAEFVRVETVGAVSHPDARSLELWALPPDEAPVSLGLMPTEGGVRLALNDRQRDAIARAPNVAVSDEPKGGSPTGAPTGPVLYVAALAGV
jgi:anti-sigma-K factor RskA